ncbi:MAG: hypothetical protein AAFQ88_02850 [Pseudomonadota bacterium]
MWLGEGRFFAWRACPNPSRSVLQGVAVALLSLGIAAPALAIERDDRIEAESILGLPRCNVEPDDLLCTEGAVMEARVALVEVVAAKIAALPKPRRYLADPGRQRRSTGASIHRSCRGDPPCAADALSQATADWMTRETQEVVPRRVIRASIDCDAGLETRIEVAICTDPTLANTHTSLLRTLKAAEETTQGTDLMAQLEQETWQTETFAACGPHVGCLQKAILARDVFIYEWRREIRAEAVVAARAQRQAAREAAQQAEVAAVTAAEQAATAAEIAEADEFQAALEAEHARREAAREQRLAAAARAEAAGTTPRRREPPVASGTPYRPYSPSAAYDGTMDPVLIDRLSRWGRDVYVGRFQRALRQEKGPEPDALRSLQRQLGLYNLMMHVRYGDVCAGRTGERFTPLDFQITEIEDGEATLLSNTELKVLSQYAGQFQRRSNALTNPWMLIGSFGLNFRRVLYDLGLEAQRDIDVVGCGTAASRLIFANLEAILSERPSLQARGEAPWLFAARCEAALPGILGDALEGPPAATCGCLERVYVEHAFEEARVRLEDDFTRERFYLSLSRGRSLWPEAQQCF